MSQGSGCDQPHISVIVPVLNESRHIDETLTALKRMPGIQEIIVVDGGSRDDTCCRAAAHGVILLASPPGRGQQMHAGALAAQEDVLWFLHADTVPAADAPSAIFTALADPSIIAGNCEVQFSGELLSARFLTWVYRHVALFGLRYGDSGYFVRREDYFAAGGFKPYPIFEDLDILRRLRKRGRFVRIPATVTTSSRRFEGRSFAAVVALWALLQMLYWFGAPPTLLGRFYRPIRAPSRWWRRSVVP